MAHFETILELDQADVTTEQLELYRAAFALLTDERVKKGILQIHPLWNTGSIQSFIQETAISHGASVKAALKLSKLFEIEAVPFESGIPAEVLEKLRKSRSA